MRLFHVSEEPDIKSFVPRVPDRDDLNKSKGLVWAINERGLPNYLAPRDCPRVTYHTHEHTTKEDAARLLSPGSRHCVAIEHAWFERMAKAVLYIYEFDRAGFYLQDDCAGYYVSEKEEIPVGVTKVTDLFAELFRHGVEVRILPDLWELADEVIKFSLNFSLIRMRNARPRL